MWNKDFSFYVTNFFAVFLPNHKGCSKNTISSYRDTFSLFLVFCDKDKNINIDNLSFEDINIPLILDFLSGLKIQENLQFHQEIKGLQLGKVSVNMCNSKHQNSMMFVLQLEKLK